MRTKTLLITAALSAAGVATSMAQVFSVNAVGYVNKTIPANTAGAGGKLALISNPLDAGAGNNTIANLFKGVPDGTQVYKYTGTGFITATYDALDGAFGPADAANTTVLPGEGVFVRNTSTSPLTVTFVGEVPQGKLDNPYPKGLSIRSSMVPQKGTAAELGFPGADGDQINQFDPATQSYYVSTFDSLNPPGQEWGPPLKQLDVGEAFFLRSSNGGTWSRTFSVNQ
jgi:hypothetical protein